MKRLYPLILSISALLFLAACESGGNFRVVNQTSYPIYIAVGEDEELAIPGGGEHTFAVETEKQSLFNPNVTVDVPVRLTGETYQIYDAENEVFVDTTTVRIKVGETTNAFINPNRGSFKVVNNSSHTVVRAELYKHNFVGVVASYELGSIAPGGFDFLPVGYATNSNNFYYYATVQMDNGNIYNYGGPTNIVELDSQFLITLIDPK